MFGRIKRFFVGTTGLTPIMPVPQVSKDVFIAVFATPPGVEPYNPFQQAGPEKKTIRDAAFETAMETIRRASQVPAILMEAAQRAGAAIIRLFEPGQASTSVIRGNDGRIERLANLGVTTKVTAEADGGKESLSPEAQANLARMRGMRQSLSRVDSPERLAFYEFINPVDQNGRVRQHAAMGWPGLSLSVKSMPIPDQYSDAGVEMDIGVSSGLVVMGASAMQCAETPESTAIAMLHRAVAMGVSVPPHPDGREWTIADRGDPRLFSALCERAESPFKIGTSLEGSPVFMRDTIIFLDRVSPGLHTTRLGQTFRKVGEQLGVLTPAGAGRRAGMPLSRPVAPKAAAAMREANVFSDYLSYARSRANSLSQKRRIDAEYKAALKQNPNADQAVLEKLTRMSMEEEHARALREAPVSWQAIASKMPDWQPGPHDVRLDRADNEVVCTGIRLPDHVREAMGTDRSEVSDLDGFSTRNLADGTYKVNGSQDYVISHDEDNIRTAAFECDPSGPVFDQKAEDARRKAEHDRNQELRKQFEAMRNASAPSFS